MFDDRAPQDQHIDARIVSSGQGIARQAGANSTGGAQSAAPRLNPWDAARLQFGNNLGGDFIIKMGAGFAAPGGPTLSPRGTLVSWAHRFLQTCPKTPLASPGAGVGGRCDLPGVPSRRAAPAAGVPIAQR